MKLIYKMAVCCFLALPFPGVSQNSSHFKAINTEVWENFTKAFETYDVELFSRLHDEELIRVSGDGKSIRRKTSYLAGYRERWQHKSGSQTISFRFLERICDGNIASERGIYKLTRQIHTPNERSYYGKFHVLLVRKNEQWKILMDYDSSEHHSINETTYASASELHDFQKFK